MLAFCDVTAISREIERRIGFVAFAVAIREFADEVRSVTSFGPCLAKIVADGTGGATNLACQRKAFFCRKPFIDFKHLHRESVSLLVSLKFLRCLNCHKFSSIACLLFPVSCPLTPSLPSPLRSPQDF